MSTGINPKPLERTVEEILDNEALNEWIGKWGEATREQFSHVIYPYHLADIEMCTDES